MPKESHGYKLNVILFRGEKILIPNIHQKPDLVKLNQQFGRTSILFIFEKFQILTPEDSNLLFIIDYSAVILFWEGLSSYFL